jgi:hypothetical protein
MTKEDLKALGKSALSKMRRKQFTVSRKISGRGGDSFLSINVEMEDSATQAECQIAYLLAFLECSEAATRAARAGSLISDDELARALKVLRHNFSKMIADADMGSR